MEGYGFEPVLSPGTAFIAETDFSELHVDIIGDHKDIFFRDLVEIHDRYDRFSGEIHECHGFEEDDFLSSHDSLGDYSFEFRVFPVLETVFLMKKVDEKKPDIVPGICVLFSRITESDDEFHFLSIIRPYFYPPLLQKERG